jgi:hypothetical protein
LTPPHVGAPEGHLTAIDKEEHAVEVAQEEAVEVTGGLGGGGGGAVERVTTDGEAQGRATEHGCCG